MPSPLRLRPATLLNCAILALAGYKLAYHAVYLASSPFAQGTFSDGRVYEDAARDVLAHAPLGTQPFYLQGAYVYQLALGLALGGGLPGALLLQLLITALAYAAFHWTAVRTWGPIQGALCTLVLLAYPGLSFYENKPLSAALGVACNIGVLWAAARLSAAPSAGRAGVLGIWAALAVLGRPNFLLALPATLACVWPVLARPLRSRAALAFALCAAATLAPLALRNAAVTGHYDILPTNGGGTTFYVGNNPHSKGLRNTAGGLISGQVGVEQFELAERLGVPKMADPIARAKAVGDVLYQRAFDYIAEQPGAWLQLLARKLWLTLGNTEISQDYDLLGEREVIPGWLRAGLPFALLLALGLCGMLAHARAGAPALAILQAVVIVATNVAFLTSFQHRLPLAVPLAFFAGPGLAALYGVWRRERAWPIAAAAALAVLLAFWPERPTRTRITTAHYYNLAVVEEQRGNLAAAAQHLAVAIARAPERIEIRLDRARLLRRLGRADLAARDLDHVAARAPLPGWMAHELAAERAQLAAARAQ